MIGFKKTWSYVFLVIAIFVCSSYGMNLLSEYNEIHNLNDKN